MFEKEAKEYATENYETCLYDDLPYANDSRAREQAFKDGAEFGYNKANEWNTETPSSAVGNKDLLLQVEKDDFEVGYYHFENRRFYTNDGREVTPLAWKEIHYSHESEK